MRNALFADIGRCAKCSQVRTHQAGEVYYDTAYRKGKCQPAITGDTLCTAPVWRCMNQIPGCQPNADVRDHFIGKKSSDVGKIKEWRKNHSAEQIRELIQEDGLYKNNPHPGL